jgi:hypothetical protein
MSRKNRKSVGRSPPVAPPSAKRPRVKILGCTLAFALGAVMAGGAFLILRPNLTSTAVARHPLVGQSHAIGSLEDLLATGPEQLAKVDIAQMNLLCATGLPGAEELDIDRCLARLDRWADRVKAETERHLYRLTDPRFKEYAEHYKNSEARFRAEWLVSVLQQDIGLHYHAGFVPQDVAVPPFKTSKETFLHGLMDNDDARKAFGGNCVSLPVAYAAVGRRLGYPIKLVCAKEHVFCRWEGTDNPNPSWRDRFNFDGAGEGFSIDPDEFYLTWPRKSTPDQVELCGWLQSLTPPEELSIFLANRGAVLSQVNKDPGTALVALAYSARLMPGSTQSIERARSVFEEMYRKIVSAHPDAYRRMVARLDAQPGNVSKFGDLPTRAGAAESGAGKVPWWKTEAGRAANLAEVERLNEEGRRDIERTMQPPLLPGGVQPPSPYGPSSGVPQPYRPLLPGQPSW